MEARVYVEAVAQELSKLRGRGLLLSPADAQLALGWHAAGVPLTEVIRAVRGGARLLPHTGAQVPRGTGSPMISLQALAPALEARLKDGAAQASRALSGRDTLEDELLRAAARPGLPERARWERLAREAEALIGRSPEHYWSAVIDALLASLRRLPRQQRLRVGAGLRVRLRRRPHALSRARYRRSLQQQLLQASSEALQLPPAAFLL